MLIEGKLKDGVAVGAAADVEPPKLNLKPDIVDERFRMNGCRQMRSAGSERCTAQLKDCQRAGRDFSSLAQTFVFRILPGSLPSVFGLLFPERAGSVYESFLMALIARTESNRGTIFGRTCHLQC